MDFGISLSCKSCFASSCCYVRSVYFHSCLQVEACVSMKNDSVNQMGRKVIREASTIQVVVSWVDLKSVSNSSLGSINDDLDGEE
jgi:hypothetical protein